MTGLLRTSVAIQVSSALVLVAQNLFAPLLLGAQEFGRAVSLVALPLLLQGVLEPAVNGASIACSDEPLRRDRLNSVWRHAAVFAAAATAISFFFAERHGGTSWQLALVAAFVLLAIGNTLLRGLAFSRQEHRLLVVHYLAALVATLIALPMLAWGGSVAYLGMMCAVQVAVLAVLLAKPEMRAESLLIITAGQRRDRARYPLATIYAGNLAARGAQLALGPGLLVMASMQLPAVRLAEFRVLQALFGALSSAVPLHPTLVQAAVSQAVKEPAERLLAGVQSQLARAVSSWLCLVGLATFVLWIAYPTVIELVLRSERTHLAFQSLTWAAPLVVAVPILGAVLLGLRYERQLMMVVATGSVALVGTGLWLGVAAALVIVSLFFVASLLVVCWSAGRGLLGRSVALPER